MGKFNLVGKKGRNYEGYQRLGTTEGGRTKRDAPSRTERRQTKDTSKNRDQIHKNAHEETLGNGDWLNSYVYQNLMPELGKEEEEFWELVEEEDVDQVEIFLRERYNPIVKGIGDFNINCKSYLGKTPLTQAVLLNNIQMVEVFLRYPEVEIGDAILYAIDAGNIRLTRKLLDFARRHRMPTGVDPKSIPARQWEFPPEEPSAHWTRDLTPLILAAQKNDYNMIKMLLRRGHVIEMPHTPYCDCVVCHAADNEGGGGLSRARVSTFHAISAPAYVFLTSRDPILTSMMLKRDLEQAAKQDSNFEAEFRQMADRVDVFLADFVACCESTDEVEIVLSQKIHRSSKQRGFHNSIFPRLELGVYYGMKRFVASTCCQIVLRRAWCGRWRTWNRMTPSFLVLHLLVRILFMPVFVVLELFFPFTSWGRWNQSPANKMLLFMASYLVFVCVVAIHIEESKSVFLRGPPASRLKAVVVVYIFGFAVNLARRMNMFGCRHAFSYYHWNKYDTIMLTLFVATFACWFWTWRGTQVHDDAWRRVPRACWSPFEPTLWGEALFALAACMSYVRVIYWYQLSSRFGPIGVSLGAMFNDAISVFAVTICLLWVSFAHALCSLFPYYYGQRWIVGGKEVKTQDPAFTSFDTSLKALFWAVLGMMPYYAADVVVGNVELNPECRTGNQTPSSSFQRFHPPPASAIPLNQQRTDIREHKPTEWTSHTLYALYHILTTVITMNMLIAVMSNAYTEISASRDLEWKFIRTKFYLEFLNKTHVLPPPFNLLPTPAGVARVCHWLRRKCGGCGGGRGGEGGGADGNNADGGNRNKATDGGVTGGGRGGIGGEAGSGGDGEDTNAGVEAECNVDQCCFLQEDEEGEKKNWTRYSRLMARLIQRYWARKETQNMKAAGDASLKTAFKRLRDRVKDLTRVSEDLLEETAALAEERRHSTRARVTEADNLPTATSPSQPISQKPNFDVYLEPKDDNDVNMQKTTVTATTSRLRTGTGRTLPVTAFGGVGRGRVKHAVNDALARKNTNDDSRIAEWDDDDAADDGDGAAADANRNLAEGTSLAAAAFGRGTSGGQLLASPLELMGRGSSEAKAKENGEEEEGRTETMNFTWQYGRKTTAPEIRELPQREEMEWGVSPGGGERRGTVIGGIDAIGEEKNIAFVGRDTIEDVRGTGFAEKIVEDEKRIAFARIKTVED